MKVLKTSRTLLQRKKCVFSVGTSKTKIFRKMGKLGGNVGGIVQIVEGGPARGKMKK